MTFQGHGRHTPQSEKVASGKPCPAGGGSGVPFLPCRKWTATLGHVGRPPGLLAGCRERDLVFLFPRNLKGPRPKASRHAMGLGGRSPIRGTCSLRTHSWPGEGPTVRPQGTMCHWKLSCWLVGVWPQARAGRHLHLECVPVPPALEKFNARAKRLLSFHSNIQTVSKPFGKTVYSHIKIPTTFSLNTSPDCRNYSDSTFKEKKKDLVMVSSKDGVL